MKKEIKNDRPEAYPKPTETDAQMKNQNEYTERQSSRHSDDMQTNVGKTMKKEPKPKRHEHRDIL